MQKTRITNKLPYFAIKEPVKHLYYQRVINGITSQLNKKYDIPLDFIDVNKKEIRKYVEFRQIFFYKLIQKGYTPTYLEYRTGVNKNSILYMVKTAENKLKFDIEFRMKFKN